MRSVMPVEFSHRMNGNGTMDSICPRCYVTVATSTWESELERAEHAHNCERKGLSVFKMTHKPPFLTTWVPQKQLNKTA